MSIHVKKAGEWQQLPDGDCLYVKVAGDWLMIGFPIPTVPTGLVAVPGPAKATMTWDAATVAEPSTIAGYDLSVGGVEQYVGNVLTYEWGGLAATATTVKVRSVSSDGRKSAWSAEVGVTPTVPYNNASGGTVREYTKTDGTVWRSHEFTSSGTITFSSIAQPVTMLVLGGGQGGGYSHPADARGNGASGPAKLWTGPMPNVGAFNVTVGGGGGGGQQVHQDGSGGGASAVAGYMDSNGGGSVTTDIRTGTAETWAGNGYGGGGGACYLCPGGSGQNGIVVIAYQIG